MSQFIKITPNNLYKPSSYFYVNFSSKKSKADVIKNLYYESKMLFGPVVKKPKNKSLKSELIDQKNYKINKINSNGTSKNEIDSERFWLIDRQSIINDRKRTTNKMDHENHHNKKENKFSTSIKVKTISESLNDIRNETNNDNSKHKTLKSSSSLETESSTSSSLTHKNFIPFNEDELKSILKFPLIINNDSKCNEQKSKQILNVFSSSISNSSTSLLKFPSVGKILQSTMSENARNALINWKLKKISELGEDGFQNFQKELLQQGKLFHKTLQEYLTSYKVPEIDRSIEGVWNSVQSALESLKPETKLIEAPIEHPYLKYCGIVDYVSYIRSNLSVIEWKKSDKIKSSINLTYDAPLQLTAYLGALNSMKDHKLNIKSGFVIIAYTNGEPAQIHYLDEILLQKYWNLWLKRLQEYWIRYRDETLPEPI